MKKVLYTLLILTLCKFFLFPPTSAAAGCSIKGTVYAIKDGYKRVPNVGVAAYSANILDEDEIKAGLLPYIMEKTRTKSGEPVGFYELENLPRCNDIFVQFICGRTSIGYTHISEPITDTLYLDARVDIPYANFCRKSPNFLTIPYLPDKEPESGGEITPPNLYPLEIRKDSFEVTDEPRSIFEMFFNGLSLVYDWITSIGINSFHAQDSTETIRNFLFGKWIIPDQSSDPVPDCDDLKNDLTHKIEGTRNYGVVPKLSTLPSLKNTFSPKIADKDSTVVCKKGGQKITLNEIQPPWEQDSGGYTLTSKYYPGALYGTVKAVDAESWVDGQGNSTATFNITESGDDPIKQNIHDPGKKRALKSMNDASIELGNKFAVLGSENGIDTPLTILDSGIKNAKKFTKYAMETGIYSPLSLVINIAEIVESTFGNFFSCIDDHLVTGGTCHYDTYTCQPVDNCDPGFTPSPPVGTPCEETCTCQGNLPSEGSSDLGDYYNTVSQCANQAVEPWTKAKPKLKMAYVEDIDSTMDSMFKRMYPLSGKPYERESGESYFSASEDQGGILVKLAKNWLAKLPGFDRDNIERLLGYLTIHKPYSLYEQGEPPVPPSSCEPIPYTCDAATPHIGVPVVNIPPGECGSINYSSPNITNTSIKGMSCDQLSKMVRCTFNGSLIDHPVNANGECDINGVKTMCEYLEEESIKAGLSPAFVKAMWIEESGASDYTIPPGIMYDMGVTSAAANNLAAQLDVFLKLFYWKDWPFRDAMWRYSEGIGTPNNEFCTNREFPERFKYYYEKVSGINLSYNKDMDTIPVTTTASVLDEESLKKMNDLFNMMETLEAEGKFSNSFKVDEIRKKMEAVLAGTYSPKQGR